MIQELVLYQKREEDPDKPDRMNMWVHFIGTSYGPYKDLQMHVHDRGRRYVVIKVPGFAAWDGQGQARNYTPITYHVLKLVKQSKRNLAPAFRRTAVCWEYVEIVQFER